ncbi:hypothetical protein D3C85_1360410 [compost metagenome]
MVAIDQGHIATAHHPGAGVAPNIAERIQLLQINVSHAGLLVQLPRRGLLRRLIGPDEAPRQRPFAQEGMPSPANEQNAQLLIWKLAIIVLLCIRNSEDHHVRRHRGPLVIPRLILLHEFAFRKSVAIQNVHQIASLILFLIVEFNEINIVGHMLFRINCSHPYNSLFRTLSAHRAFGRAISNYFLLIF